MFETKRVISEYAAKKINNDEDNSIPLVVKPPAKDYNGDKSIFYNTIEIQPQLSEAVFQIGFHTDELSIRVLNQKQFASYVSKSEEKVESALFQNRVNYLFKPQTIHAKFEPHMFEVKPLCKEDVTA
jgi:hypothetical protein